MSLLAIVQQCPIRAPSNDIALADRGQFYSGVVKIFRLSLLERFYLVTENEVDTAL